MCIVTMPDRATEDRLMNELREKLFPKRKPTAPKALVTKWRPKRSVNPIVAARMFRMIPSPQAGNIGEPMRELQVEPQSLPIPGPMPALPSPAPTAPVSIPAEPDLVPA